MHSQGTPEYIPLPDGRRLYAQVLPPAAESGITVVFEGGGASTRSIWARVQPQIAVCARAIVYDRAGLVLADPAEYAADAAGAAGELTYRKQALICFQAAWKGSLKNLFCRNVAI